MEWDDCRNYRRIEVMILQETEFYGSYIYFNACLAVVYGIATNRSHLTMK
jgi:hypothetical protein